MTELRKLQLVQLEMLKEVDRICRKHNIQYFLAAGTLLGAVRHSGFIPWDDDLDISMPHKDYKLFCEVCKTELNNADFFLQTISNDPHYRYIFAKLRRNNTLYVRKGQEHMKYHHGICIDIFPWYPAPSSYIADVFFRYIVSICKMIMWSPIGSLSEKKIIRRMWYKLLSFIPINIPHGVVHFLISKCSGQTLEDLGEPFYGNKKRQKRRMKNVGETIPQIKEKMQIKKYVEVDFEDMKCFIPDNYHYYLTCWYGDYMQLPPESKRKGHHHASIIKFDV